MENPSTHKVDWALTGEIYSFPRLVYVATIRLHAQLALVEQSRAHPSLLPAAFLFVFLPIDRQLEKLYDDDDADQAMMMTRPTSPCDGLKVFW